MAKTVSKLFLKEANKNNFKAGKKKNQSIENWKPLIGFGFDVIIILYFMCILRKNMSSTKYRALKKHCLKAHPNLDLS